MKEIYSKINPEIILHKVIRANDFEQQRTELMEEFYPLQVAKLNLKNGSFFEAHKHVDKPVSYHDTTKEAWVVIKGHVIVKCYDMDDLLIEEIPLFAGDCFITIYGGHSFEIKGDSIVYEFKSGPYLGKALDKVML